MSTPSLGYLTARYRGCLSVGRPVPSLAFRIIHAGDAGKEDPFVVAPRAFAGGFAVTRGLIAASLWTRPKGGR